MPDYLGEHQRKVKQDDKDDDTIQGSYERYLVQIFMQKECIHVVNVSPTCTSCSLFYAL